MNGHYTLFNQEPLKQAKYYSRVVEPWLSSSWACITKLTSWVHRVNNGFSVGFAYEHRTYWYNILYVTNEMWSKQWKPFDAFYLGIDLICWFPNHPIWRIFHYHPAIGIPRLRKPPMKFQCLPNCSIPPWGNQRTGVLWTREIRRDIITWYEMYVIVILHHIIILSGWWFGTFFMFPYIGNSTPNWLICFRGVGIPPTSYHNLSYTAMSVSAVLPFSRRICSAARCLDPPWKTMVFSKEFPHLFWTIEWGCVISVWLFVYIETGWWFQTFVIFHNIWDNPSH